MQFFQAVNPLKDYGYPSDYGLPMASLASNNSCYITSNPLSELEEEEMTLQVINYLIHLIIGYLMVNRFN